MPDRLSSERLEELLAGVVGRRVLIVGDVMLDRYVWGRVGRISPEAPVPVVEVERDTILAGGAANVARTVRALGGEPLLVGVVGEDSGAEELRAILEGDGIDPGHLVVDADRRTTVKTRILAEKQQVCRVDREDRHTLSAELNARLSQVGGGLMKGSGALLLSDYGKGVLSAELIHGLMEAAGGKPAVVDPKQDHFDAYHGVTTATPNHHEAAGAVGLRDDYDNLDAVAAALFERTGLKSLLITCGARGMRIYEEPGSPARVIETVAREVFDVTGAGDTVSGVLALALAGGAGLLEGALLANLAAGVVVGKVGAATASPDELRRRHRELTARSATRPGA